jgi:hypothetical protein
MKKIQKKPNRPVHRIPCLRHFWHFGCGAASDARSKRDAVTGDVSLRKAQEINFQNLLIVNMWWMRNKLV